MKLLVISLFVFFFSTHLSAQQVYVENAGSDNVVSISQVNYNSYNPSSSLNVYGNFNSVTIEQVSGNHYASSIVSGDGNSIVASQNGVAHSLTATITGSYNSINSTQTGSSSHFLEVVLVGPGNAVTVNQSGGSPNRANISLINAGGPASVNLTQTGGQNYSLQQTCVSPVGCGPVVIRQGN